MNNKLLVGIMIILVFVVGCSQSYTSNVIKEPEPAKQPIKIGLAAPLTFEPILGESSLLGAEVAVDEINTKGGIDGRVILLIAEDTQCNGKMAANAGQKLVNVDKVNVIMGTVCSAATLAIAPIAEENKVVLVSIASSNPSITDAGDYIFRVWPSDSLQGVVMAEYLYNERGFRRIATIYQNSDYNVGLTNVLTERFKELGGEVVADEVYSPEAKDFKTELTKIKAAKPDAIYVVPYSKEGAILIKQIKELGLDADVFGPEIINEKMVEDSEGAAEGIVFTTPQFDEEAENTKQFIQKYEAMHGKESPYAVVSANAYDAIMIISEAIKANGESAEGIRDYLYTIEDYPGVAGKLTIDENGDALKEYKFQIVEDGKISPLEK